jgi:glycerate 2-kinase
MPEARPPMTSASDPGSAPEAILRELFAVAVRAAMPAKSITQFVALAAAQHPGRRPYLLAIGKAAVPMASAALEALPAGTRGTILTYGHLPDGWAPPAGVDFFEAAHPVPDAAGERAAQRIRDDLLALGESDLVLALISGGGSALLSLPIDGLSLEQKRAITSDLLASGAAIDQINTVRKHLSAVKGGKLAVAAWPGVVETAVISDVAGDDPAMVASGPTLPDHSTPADAVGVLDRYDISVPAVLRAAQPDAPNHPAFAAATAPTILASAAMMLAATAEAAAGTGLAPEIVGDDETRAAAIVAQDHAMRALQLQAAMKPGDRPRLLLSGGETSVVVTNRTGQGGRNATYLLAMALALKGAEGIYAIACDTDGIDGNGELAGGLIGPGSLTAARSAGCDPQAALRDAQSHAFLTAARGAIITGPTLTNVNDFRAILILPARSALDGAPPLAQV